MPHISVVIPFFNAEKYIEGCIQSLLAQSYPRDRYEIIMVDNNSTDSSRTIVQRYSGITLLEEKKRGSYSARNRGLAAAEGDIIAFTDSDCVPYSDWLQNIAAAMDSSDAKIVLGSRQLGYDSFALSLLAAYENTKKEHIFKSDIKERYFGHTNNMAVHRKLFDQLGPFSERARGSDTIFVQRAVEKYSSDSVRFYHNIRVRHMEINSLGTYYSKMFIHGRSAGKHKEITPILLPSFQEGLQILQKTVHQEGKSLVRLAFLFSLLIVSRICWNLGKETAIWGLREYPTVQ